MVKINPDCLRIGRTKQIVFTNRGYFLPCCECDTNRHRSEFEARGFNDSSLHIDNFKSIDDVSAVFNSDTWQKFYKGLFDNPENAPTICQEFCGGDKNDT